MNAQDHLSDAENDLNAGRLAGAVQHVIYAISALASAECEATAPSHLPVLHGHVLRTQADVDAARGRWLCPGIVVGGHGLVVNDLVGGPCPQHRDIVSDEEFTALAAAEAARWQPLLERLAGHDQATPPSDPAPVVGDAPGVTTTALPHSRACGWRKHDHGPACSRNCPTCGGSVIAPQTPSTPEAPPAPAPGEAAVEALARVLDHYGIDHLDTAALIADLLAAVPGYGPTGASVGAGEVEAREHDESILVHAMRRHPGVIRHQPDQAGIGACGTTSTGFLREYDDAIENAYQRGRAAR